MLVATSNSTIIITTTHNTDLDLHLELGACLHKEHSVTHDILQEAIEAA